MRSGMNPFGARGRTRRPAVRQAGDPRLGRFLRRVRKLGATRQQVQDVTAAWPTVDEATRGFLEAAPDDVLAAAIAGDLDDEDA